MLCSQLRHPFTHSVLLPAHRWAHESEGKFILDVDRSPSITVLLNVSYDYVLNLWDCGQARRVIQSEAYAAALAQHNIDAGEYEFRELYFQGGDFGCRGGGAGWVGCGHPSRQPYPGGCSVYNYGFSTRLSHHEIGHNLGVCTLRSSHPGFPPRHNPAILHDALLPRTWLALPRNAPLPLAWLNYDVTPCAVVAFVLRIRRIR